MLIQGLVDHIDQYGNIHLRIEPPVYRLLLNSVTYGLSLPFDEKIARIKPGKWGDLSWYEGREVKIEVMIRRFNFKDKTGTSLIVKTIDVC